MSSGVEKSRHSGKAARRQDARAGHTYVPRCHDTRRKLGATMDATSALHAHRAIIRRLVDDVLNGGRLDVIDDLYAPELASDAKRWIAPFQVSFPDMRMEIIDLIAEGETVVGRFTCSATHLGEWLGHPPTGRRFEAIDEVSIFRFRKGRIVGAWGIEENLTRLEQLGLR